MFAKNMNLLVAYSAARKTVTLNPSALRMVTTFQQRQFRSGFMNPYKHDPTPMSGELRQSQQTKPVWDRVFDHKKYMEQEGPLKLSTGIAFLDVEPFPRMKLMKLYYLILDEINQLPDEYGYKYLSRETTRFRMKVVDENLSIREIENQIAAGLIEELIFQAHNEIKLLRVMKKWRPWEHLTVDADEQRELLQNMANFKQDNPFPAHFESYEADRHDRKPRK